jgi:hypothetical protein
MDHSTLVGGSTADRRIGCPASFKEENKVPASIRNKSSSYADEGTALHSAMQHIFENDIIADEVEDQLLGREFATDGGSIVITQKHLDEAIMPCVDYIEALMDELADEGEFRFELETRCAMPGIEGAFGTTDFVFRTDKRTGIIDYKFGEGVPVKASYTDADGKEFGNRQLMFYGRAAMDTLPEMFGKDKDWPVELHILQPRARDATYEEKFTFYQSDVVELEAFRQTLIGAIQKAQGPSPTHTKGPWCRFAACKTVCPLHTGAIIDTGKLMILQKNAGQMSTFEYEKHLGLVLELWHIAEAAGKEALAQAQTYLENGGQILDPFTNEPEWKLVPKRGQEKVVDEEGMIKHVKFVGLPDDKIYEPRTARSPAQLGKEMVEFITHNTEGEPIKTKKDREAEARRQLRAFTHTASSGNTLARMDDKRPDVTPTPKLLDDLAGKLALLSPQQK